MPNADRAGRPVLASISIRASFLIDELRLGKLSETVVVVGNVPHDRSRFLMCHLIGNRASFLCAKAPMVRIPNELSGWHSQDLLGGDALRLGYEECIGAKKHLVLGLSSHTG